MSRIHSRLAALERLMGRADVNGRCPRCHRRPSFLDADADGMNPQCGACGAAVAAPPAGTKLYCGVSPNDWQHNPRPTVGPGKDR